LGQTAETVRQVFAGLTPEQLAALAEAAEVDPSPR
jgi:hypothetical protein